MGPVDSNLALPTSLSQEELLENDECILIVDDYADIVVLLQDFLEKQGFPTITASSASDLRTILHEKNVALTLLDIGLPDADGMALLPELKRDFPNSSYIMLTAVTDLQTVLNCLRQGADDYLTKPVQLSEFLGTVRSVLIKRRLTINSRRHQRQLEQAHFRIRLLHELTMKMNSAYLSMTELDEILQAILVGITAEEGLRFNRAFLALFNESGDVLEGRMAIGPGCLEEAGRIWHNMHEQNMHFQDIIASIQGHCFSSDHEVNRIVRGIRVETSIRDHILIQAARNRRAVNVVNGRCGDIPVPAELLGLLEVESFVVVPLYSPSRSLGVLIADNYVTNQPITSDLIDALESFTSQASLAIEHCHLYMAMENKVKELEALTEELETNKDLLLESERYSAVGHMAAQMAHQIRNPITSIGGTARLLSRKTKDPEQLKFLHMMTSEAARIERTLEDLFSFVEQVKPAREHVPLYPLIHKSLMLYYRGMQKQKIVRKLVLPDIEPVLFIDPRLMHQVFVHLIRNSLEAMLEGGELMIEVQSHPEKVDIIFRDTGIGLGEGNIERATDPFYTTKVFGTGMGLTLVRRIVRDHGGTFTIRNREKVGAEVIISLPTDINDV